MKYNGYKHDVEHFKKFVNDNILAIVSIGTLLIVDIVIYFVGS